MFENVDGRTDAGVTGILIAHLGAFGSGELKNINTGLQIRVCIGKLFSLFLIQNICCGYSKEPSQ